MNVRSPIPLRPDRDAMFRTERRSWQRAIAGHVLACLQPGGADKIVEGGVARRRARGLDYARRDDADCRDRSTRPATSSRVSEALAPGSAALKLFELGLMLDLRGITHNSDSARRGLAAAANFHRGGRAGAGGAMVVCAEHRLAQDEKLFCSALSPASSTTPRRRRLQR